MTKKGPGRALFRTVKGGKRVDIYAYWDAVLGQREDDMRRFFLEGAVVNLSLIHI